MFNSIQVFHLEKIAMLEFEGKVALVTGASRRIGAAVALALGQRGGSVVVNYLSGKERAERVAAQVEAAGGHWSSGLMSGTAPPFERWWSGQSKNSGASIFSSTMRATFTPGNLFSN